MGIESFTIHHYNLVEFYVNWANEYRSKIFKDYASEIKLNSNDGFEFFETYKNIFSIVDMLEI